MLLEKTLKSLLDNKEIKPVHPKGNQSWIFIGRSDAEAEALILWPPDVKNWLVGKDPDAGKYWGQEEKGMAEDEVAGWLDGITNSMDKSACTPGDSEGQGKRECCTSWGCKELDTTKWLNNNKYQYTFANEKYVCLFL